MTTSTDRRGGPRHERQYQTPDSLEDAYRRREALATAIIEIEGQLARRNRIDPETGVRMTPTQYGQWRDRANEARVAKTNEVRYLKQWIRDNRVAVARPKDGGLTPADIREAVWSPALNRAYFDTIIAARREEFREAARTRAVLQHVGTLISMGHHVGDILLAALMQAERSIEDLQARERARLATSLDGIRVGSGFGAGGHSGPDGGAGHVGSPSTGGGAGGRSGWEDAGGGDTRTHGEKGGTE